MPTLRVQDVELFFELDGEGSATVAFLNGVAMTVSSWQAMRKRFRDRGFRCLLHDFRGQLRSGKPTDRPYSFKLHAADLLGLLDALEVERVHLAGTSYGAEVGMVFAYEHPSRVESLTVIAGVSEIDPLLRAAALSWAAAADCGGVAFFRCLAPWAYSGRYLAENEKLLHGQEEASARLPSDFFAGFKQLVAAFLQLDVTAELARIACPTLVMAAEEDLIKGPKRGQRIHEGIVNSEFLVIPKAGHAVVLERPDDVAEATIAFIDRQRP